MYNPHDPRFRRTLNTVSQRLESANETAQISLFSLSENCLKPCFFSVSNCLTATTETCFPTDDRTGGSRRRRQPRPARGRLERSFDFYDDWEEDENDALIAWENDEYDRLLEDDGEAAGQPARRGIMNYGTSGTDAIIRAIGGSGTAVPRRPPRRGTGEPDPTIIPNQSFFGFLDRLPFKIGPRGLRYKPSAAGLRDRPKDPKEEEPAHGSRTLRRARSDTVNSHRTEGSLSSRGDIFPSDDEVEDAVAFDDEFAARLLPDDNSSGKTRKERRKMKRVASRGSPTHSSQTTSRRDSGNDLEPTDIAELKQNVGDVDVGGRSHQPSDLLGSSPSMTNGSHQSPVAGGAQDRAAVKKPTIPDLSAPDPPAQPRDRSSEVNK